MDEAGWDRRYEEQDFVWTVTANRFVREHIADLEPGDAIDLAAGECRNAVWLAQRGWHVVAVDFSAVGLDKGRQLAVEHGVAERVDIVVADATSWEPAVAVDLVVLSYLQLPSDVQVDVLHRVRDWVRPGGCVFVVAHDRSNVADGHGGPPDPDVCYDLDRTVAALGGLDIEVAEVAERPVDTESGTVIALDTVVVARRPD